MPAAAPTSEPRFEREPAVLWRRVDRTVLLLLEGEDDAIALTGSGADLWDVLAAPTTLADACTELSGRYSTDPATISDDVERAVADLERRGLVHRAG